MKSKTKIAKNKKSSPLSDTKVMHTENKNIIKLRVPNTKFWVLGERRSASKWNIFLINPQNPNYKEPMPPMTTKMFSIFSNVVLKTPFPYQG
jgi:hypothetical protein